MKKHIIFILTIFISIVYSKFCYVYSSEIILSENAQKGLEIAQEHCSRCHIVSEKNRYSSIETTPSFFGLRKMSDWQERFREFFVRPPHPALVNIIDVTEEKNPNYSIYTDGNPYSEMRAGQGKIHLVDYDHDGDIDVVDSSTRTYVLINNGDVFELYDNFVDLDEDWILWPIEIDNKFDYDFIGSFTDSNGRDYSLTTYFQVLDPQNEALLNNFLSKGSVYSEYILSSVNQYNEVRRSSRNKDFIYKDYEDSYVFGVNSNHSDYLNLFAGTAKGVLQGNFIGLSKEISAIRLGFIYTNNNPQNFNSNDLWGNSISNLEFKTGSAFVERSIAVNDLAINVGISYDKIFINQFEEKGNFLHLHFNSLNTLSQNVFVDIYYPFKIFGFTGSLNIGSSKRKFSSNFNLSSSESFELPSKISKTYTEGELSLVRGPLFLSIDYLEGKSPIFNIGFKLISYLSLNGGPGRTRTSDQWIMRALVN